MCNLAIQQTLADSCPCSNVVRPPDVASQARTLAVGVSNPFQIPGCRMASLAAAGAPLVTEAPDPLPNAAGR